MRILSLPSFFCALALSFVLPGCMFQPLYGEKIAHGQMKAQLHAVDIAPAENRLTQIVRNELTFSFYGGGSVATTPAYRLKFSVRESKGNILVEKTGVIESSVMILIADYEIEKMGLDEKERAALKTNVVKRGTVSARASYDRTMQRFSNVRAEVDAEKRAAGVLAEHLRLQVAGFLASQK